MGDDNRSKNNGWQTSEEGTRVGLDILVEPPLSFTPEGQSEIVWYPIQIVDAPIPAELPSLRELALEKELEEKRPMARETMRKVPGTYLLKDCVKCIDLAQGQYICKEYTTIVFRKKTKTILFLVPIDENREPTTDIVVPVHDHFLEKEVERIGELQNLLQPIVCRVGIEKTTPQKKKDRLFYIVAHTAT